MSRWSAESLRIGLAPDRVDLARLPWLRGRAAARTVSAPCEPRPGEPAWQAALDALDTLLAEAGLSGRGVTVVLSSHWVRHAVLPWQPEVARDAELEQLARLRFEQVYGNAAADWTLRVCDGGWGRPYLACAVDTALVQALQQRLGARGMKLDSLQPLLMAATNALRRELAGVAALAIVERGRACIGVRDGASWSAVTTRRTGSDAAAAVEQELATQDDLAAGAPLGLLLVGEGAHWPGGGARPVRHLGAGGADAAGAPRPLALCGVA